METKSSDREKYTQETIQISLVRSIRTSAAANTGDKSSNVTSGRQTSKLTESKESVKDSVTTCSSSDTDPISLTDNDEETSADSDEEDSEYSDEYSDSEPTEQSQEESSYSYQITSRSTDATKSGATKESEMSKITSSRRSKPLPSPQNDPSNSGTSKETSKKSSDGMSFETTNTTNTTNSASTSYVSSPHTTTLTSPLQDSTNATSTTDPCLKPMKTLNENDYIRAHLTLPTNEVISILMRKDQNLGKYFGPTQGNSVVNETGDSNHYSEPTRMIDGERYHSRSKEPIHETIREIPTLKAKIGDKTVATANVSTTRRKLILKHKESSNRNERKSTKQTHDTKQNSRDKQGITQTSIPKSSHLDKASRTCPKPQLLNKFNERTFKKNNGSRNQAIPVNKASSSYKKSNEKKPSIVDRMNGAKVVNRHLTRPISFNLPTLPKLNKSVTFRINTESIKERQLQCKSFLDIKRNQDYRLSNLFNMKESDIQQVQNSSSLRCPQFITFEQENSKREMIPNETENPKKAVERVLKVGRNTTPSRRSSLFDVGKSLRNKRIQKSNIAQKIINANKDKPSDVRSQDVVCSGANLSIISLPAISERSMSSKKTASGENCGRVCQNNIFPRASNQHIYQNSRVCTGKVNRSRQLSIEKQQLCLQNRPTYTFQKNRHQDEPKTFDSEKRHFYRNENVSPSGITKNHVRFYEANRLTQPDLIKYNFQVIRNKFESNTSRETTEKRPYGNQTPFNFGNLCKTFPSKNKLNKYNCSDERPKKNSFQANDYIKRNNNAKETFNTILKEIMCTVERKKSGRRDIDDINQTSHKNVGDTTTADLCTFCKLNDNDTEFKQLQHIFQTVKRTYKKKLMKEAGKSSCSKGIFETSDDEYASTIGQQLCRIYLKCFSKIDLSPYTQNDFVNIRKVVDFFLNYLVFEYKYLYTQSNVSIVSIVYSVYAKISQHHFRLKHHLSTSSEIGSQNDPWPMKVYNQLTRFNNRVNSKSVSNTNYKVSTTSTKLRPSFSTHSEHSIKYFAIDYFLKLLKVIVIEGQDVKPHTKETVSERATASSFNSHQYCAIQSGITSSPSVFSPQLEPIQMEESHTKEEEEENISTKCQQMEYESVANTTRVQTIKAKLKRFKKRKARKCVFDKQTNRSLNTKQACEKLEADPKKFELGRYMINKNMSIKDENLRQSQIQSILQPSQTNFEGTNEEDQNKKENISEISNHNCTAILHPEAEPAEIPHMTPPPPAPPSEPTEEINTKTIFINEVSNLVSQIVRINKNANLEKIKEQINIILNKNSIETDETKKESNIATQTNKQECGIADCVTQEIRNEAYEVKSNDNVLKEISDRNSNSNKSCKTIRKSLLEHLKQNLKDISPQKKKLKAQTYVNDTTENIQELDANVKEDVMQRDTIMIPVNMIKNPHREQVGWKKDLRPRETTHDMKDRRPNVAGKLFVKDREQSASCENRQIFNNIIRNKVISNKINQKILELTKNTSMEIRNPPIAYEQMHTENKLVERNEMSPRYSMKNFTKDTFVQYNQREMLSNKFLDKKVEFEKFEERNGKRNQRPTEFNQKTPIISNDDLFFTNRRKLSIFNRPFHSILGFESDLLSESKESDDDMTVHEIYFKKPYYRHDSNSFTDLNHDVTCAKRNFERKQNLVQDTKEKYLSKKQLEVFDKLRTMYEKEMDLVNDSKPVATTENSQMLHALDSILNNSLAEPNNLERDQSFSRRRTSRKSRSQSCIYQSTFQSTSPLSSRIWRSSESLLDLN